MEQSVKPHTAAVKTPVKAKRFIEAIGRRKTAVARVRITSGETGAVVNGKTVKEYFPVERIQKNVLAPLVLLKLIDDFGVSVRVSGGGVAAQAEAVRHGLARALAEKDEALARPLRVAGFLTRDPRMVERKKYGLKKARRAPQWSKR